MKTQLQNRQVSKERFGVLHQLEEWLEPWMVGLGFVSLVLLLLELTRGTSPFQERLSSVIWIIFITDFSIKLVIAPRKIRYLRRNWLTAVSLGIPALRVFRLARAFRLIRMGRATRGLRLLKIVGSLNRGMRGLSATMQRQRFSYVLALTVIVTLAGAAGMYAFERSAGARGLNDYGSALWWTAMIMTTMGSEYWPVTWEGRILCVLLSLYAFAVFGYVTATLATFFIDRNLNEERPAGPGSNLQLESTLRELKAEVILLRSELRQGMKMGDSDPGASNS